MPTKIKKLQHTLPQYIIVPPYKIDIQYCNLDEESKSIGQWIEKKNLILIESDLMPYMQARTLFHEFLHSSLELNGFVFEENSILALETLFNYLFNPKNKHLIDYFQEVANLQWQSI